MQAYPCAVAICVVVSVSANIFAADVDANNRQYNVVKLATASFANGLLINQGIDTGHNLIEAELLLHDSALEVAGI